MNFFLDNWSAIIASISLAISLYTLYKNRARIDVSWNKNISEEPINSVFLLKNGKETPLNCAYLTHVDIINPSPRDIGFFGLSAFNPVTNMSLYLLTKKTIGFGFEDAVAVKRDPAGRETRLDIPESNVGIIKANSITKLDLVVVLTGNEHDVPNLAKLDTIAIRFYIPKYVLFNRDPYSKGTFKKYWYKGMLYSITGWQERRQQQLQALSKEAEHAGVVPDKFQKLQKSIKSLIKHP